MSTFAHNPAKPKYGKDPNSQQTWRLGHGSDRQLALLAGRALKSRFRPQVCPPLKAGKAAAMSPNTCAWALSRCVVVAKGRKKTVVFGGIPFLLNGQLIPENTIATVCFTDSITIDSQPTRGAKCGPLLVWLPDAASHLLELPLTCLYAPKTCKNGWAPCIGIIGAEWVCTTCWQRFGGPSLKRLADHFGGNLTAGSYWPVTPIMRPAPPAGVYTPRHTRSAPPFLSSEVSKRFKRKRNSFDDITGYI